jgi:hypothetical protein
LADWAYADVAMVRRAAIPARTLYMLSLPVLEEIEDS